MTKNPGIQGGTDVWFYSKKKGAGEKEEQRMDAVGMVFSKVPDDYPFEKREGRLLAFELDEGAYNLTRWEIYLATMFGAEYISPWSLSPLSFSIKAGEITYIGNLHVASILDENTFGAKVAASGEAISHDSKDLDFQLLNEKYPNISEWPINEQLLITDKWD